MTPLPEGSGRRPAPSGRRTRRRGRLRPTICARSPRQSSTSCGSATRGARSARTATSLSGLPSDLLVCRGSLETGQFAGHAADIPDRRLSAARLAGEHGLGLRTSVTQIADSLTWLRGRHTIKIGAISAGSA